MLALEEELKTFTVKALEHHLGGQVSTLSRQVNDPLYSPDVELRVKTAQDDFLFVCEAVRYGTPAVLRQKLIQLNYYLHKHALEQAFGLISAESLSEQSMDLCRNAHINCLDLAGNIYLQVGKTHVDIQGRSLRGTKASSASGAFDNIFATRASRVVHALLMAPERQWRIQELADQVEVSLGHVSNVTSALQARGWLEQSGSGFRLTNPAELLDAWVKAYRRSRARLARYTTLQGLALEGALRTLQEESPKVLLAAESAARYVAPYLRSPHTTLYVRSIDLAAVEDALKLKVIPEGGNVRCLVVNDGTAFQQPQELAPGLWGTSDLRTYLDLHAQGERSQDAAELLRHQRIEPMWTLA